MPPRSSAETTLPGPLARLSAELRDALAERFGEAFARAEEWQPAALPARSFRREPDQPAFLEPGLQALMMRAEAAREPDEVDRLFGVRPLE
ncbi:MAG TPA: hypothetical protein VNK94_04675 [Gaiellaceae bacterium]|nr:hypothetical protein [Gaiellaceae bacterium]